MNHFTAWRSAKDYGIRPALRLGARQEWFFATLREKSLNAHAAKVSRASRSP